MLTFAEDDDVWRLPNYAGRALASTASSDRPSTLLAMSPSPQHRLLFYPTPSLLHLHPQVYCGAALPQAQIIGTAHVNTAGHLTISGIPSSLEHALNTGYRNLHRHT
jgi:hypothetical protein